MPASQEIVHQIGAELSGRLQEAYLAQDEALVKTILAALFALTQPDTVATLYESDDTLTVLGLKFLTNHFQLKEIAAQAADGVELTIDTKRKTLIIGTESVRLNLGSKAMKLLEKFVLASDNTLHMDQLVPAYFKNRQRVYNYISIINKAFQEAGLFDRGVRLHNNGASLYWLTYTLQ